MTIAFVLLLMRMLSHHANQDWKLIASSIATAVYEDQAKGYDNLPLEAALMVRYAWDEAHFSIHPIPISWDAKSHRVCGVWQLSCDYVEKHTVLEQARYWLTIYHSSCGLSCLSPSKHKSRIRLSLAMGMLNHVIDQGIAENQR